jgi:hypothetical protein
MPSHIDDPDYWRGRAAEARAIAEGMKNPSSKRTLENVAQSYDNLADHAQAVRNRASDPEIGRRSAG